MPKPVKPAVAVAFQTLKDLLGKTLDDPAVTAAFAKAGKVTTKTEFVIAKEAGFDFSVSRPEGTKRRTLISLFLFPEGQDGHRAFADLPAGLIFGPRPQLLAKMPAPRNTWKIGPGKVPVETPDATWDQWSADGLTLTVTYTKGSVRHINVKLPATS